MELEEECEEWDWRKSAAFEVKREGRQTTQCSAAFFVPCVCELQTTYRCG